MPRKRSALEDEERRRSLTLGQPAPQPEPRTDSQYEKQLE
jgi:hypothetical protein